MSERVIAIKRKDDSPEGRRVSMAYAVPLPVYYEPDPEGPDVSEMIKSLNAGIAATLILAQKEETGGSSHLAKMYRDGAKQAKAIIARLDTHDPLEGGMSEWRPIETAPRDGTEILGAWRYGNRSQWFIEPVEYSEWTEGWSISWDHDDVNPSHWMPMPDPPDTP